MEKNNNIISATQIGIIGYFLGNAFFVGMGNLNINELVNQDAWISGIISILICLIPIGFLLYIINYQPDKNILEKNKIIFGKWLGQFVNIIISLYVFLIFVILLWATTNYSVVIYLTDTPKWFITSLFLIVIIYTVVKGIETIARTSEILFLIANIMMIIIVLGLLKHSSFYNVKPIMRDGVIPVLKGSILYLAYSFPPLLSLLIIPKKNIKNEKKFNKYLLGGFIFSIITMVIVFYINISVITTNLTDLYRLPSYYVLKKIVITDYFNNIENYISIHWFLPLLVTMIMCLYFLSEYIKQTFKIQKKKYMNLSIIVIAAIAGIVSNYLFKNGTDSLVFMGKTFPYLISLIILAILVITSIIIYIKKKIQKNNNQEYEKEI